MQRSSQGWSNAIMPVLLQLLWICSSCSGVLCTVSYMLCVITAAKAQRCPQNVDHLCACAHAQECTHARVHTHTHTHTRTHTHTHTDTHTHARVCTLLYC